MKVVRTFSTSANIGPGFDCLGICFDLYNDYSFEESDEYIEQLIEKIVLKSKEYYRRGQLPPYVPP